MYARACPKLRGWSEEPKGIIPSLQNLHPGGGHSREAVALGITHRQDHQPQMVKAGCQTESLGGIMAQVPQKRAQS